MPQLFEIDKRLVAIHELRPARGFSKHTRGLGEAEETVELSQDADRA